MSARDQYSTRLTRLTRPSRRTFVKGLATCGAAASIGVLREPAWAQSRPRQEWSELSGTEFNLRIGETDVNVTGKSRTALTINESLPGLLLRWKEGDTVTLNVANGLDEDTSIHWHGILLPATMDGVPGLSFAGIHPRQAYRYRFTVKQHGTYWHHSHSGFQEQQGVYGPLVVEPREPEPFQVDREHVVMLTDWTDEHPERIFKELKKQSNYYNFRQRTLGTFFRDVRKNGLSATLAERRMWGDMRMSAGDLADVTGYTYTYLLNGRAPAGNWTGLFAPGEKVRLRFINGSAMSYFDVRIPGLKMTVVAADGLPVRPVAIDEFRIAVAENFDVIVEPSGQEAFTIVAQAMDRTGFAAGTLATRPGLSAPVPDVDPRPVLTMADMGHGGMEHDMGAMRASPTAAQAPAAAPDPHAGHVMPAPTPPPPDPHAGHVMPQSAAPDPHAGHDMSATSGAMQVHPPSEQGNPLVDMQTMSPSSKLDDPGIGLRDNGRRVLTYADLTSVFDDPDGREPRSANTRLTCRRAAVGAIESRPTRRDGERITATCSSTWRLGCSGKYAWTKGGSHDAARGEGDRVGGRFEQAQTNLLYGRAIARWWDVTAGVRLDTLPDTPRTALAVGLQDLAPYWFEVEASAYVETSGRTHVRVETEYDLLLTNRLVLQPLVEFEIYGRADPERGIDAGLSTGELGLRLRYEFRRELAPYVGLVWNRKFFGTADYAEAAGERTSGARLAVGVRLWM